MWYPILIAFLVSYLLGNLNGSVCISALKAKEDVRSHGSGNAGLTNFVRNYGTAGSLLVILIDGGKPALACLLGGRLLQPYGLQKEGQMLGAVAVTLGHNFPATLGFRGGKGTLCGAVAALCVDWRICAVLLTVFVITVALTRLVSLGSVLGAAGFAIGFGVLYWHQPWVAAGGIFLGVLAIVMHRKNIVRLLQGTESKLVLKGKKK